MKIAEAKSLFRAGGLKQATIVPAFMTEGYSIQILVNRGTLESEPLMSKSGKIRIFKRVEAAIKALSEIGFSEAKITFD